MITTNKLIATMAGIALLSSFHTLAGDKVAQEKEASTSSRIEIENLRGQVKIEGWDNAKVSVKGELDDQAESFIFESDGERVKIKVVMPEDMRSYNNRDGSDLVIMVPQSASVKFNGVSTNLELKNLLHDSDIKTVSGDIKADNLAKRVELTTVSGDIVSQNLDGKLHLTTVSGNIKDSGSSGRIDYRAVSGSIKVNSSAKDVVLSVVSGDLEAELANVEDADLNVVNGDIDATLGLVEDAKVKASSVNGDINLEFAKDVSASFYVKTKASDSIKNKLTSDKAVKAQYGPSAKLNFTTGNGDATVNVSTVSGSIKLTD